MINFLDKLTGLRALWQFDNRWQLICDRLLFKSPISVYRWGELEFLIDHDAGDHNGTRLCLVSDIYTRFLPKMRLPERVSVFDLGANGGGFPLMLLRNRKRLAKLLCVEMNPNTFRRLHYNVTRNVAADAEGKLVNAAVCGERKTFELSLGSGDISDSIYRRDDAPSSAEKKRYRIEGYTFDELFAAHFDTSVIDICKMDIEGAEFEVLASGAHDCLRRCRYLIIELHRAPAETIQRFEQALAAAGFALLDAGDGAIPGERLYSNTALASQAK